MPSPNPTFEKIYIEMYCKTCIHWKYDKVNRQKMCMLPAVIESACNKAHSKKADPGFMYKEKSPTPDATTLCPRHQGGNGV